jgi:excisionase family DNA binding protein
MRVLPMTDNPDRAPSGERLIDLDAIAERLGISVKSVRRLLDRGELAYHRIGRLKRVSESDYAAYLASRRQIGR